MTDQDVREFFERLAVLEPIPTARVKTATAQNPGLPARVRTP